MNQDNAGAIDEAIAAVSRGWQCCCCDLPVLHRDGPCPKQNPERYAHEAAALVRLFIERLAGPR
jgi:hypothetical protein